MLRGPSFQETAVLSGIMQALLVSMALVVDTIYLYSVTLMSTISQEKVL